MSFDSIVTVVSSRYDYSEHFSLSSCECRWRMHYLEVQLHRCTERPGIQAHQAHDIPHSPRPGRSQLVLALEFAVGV